MYRGKYEAVKTAEKKNKKTPETVQQTPEVSWEGPEPDIQIEKPVRKARKKGITKGTIVFYSVWLLLIVVAFFGIGIALGALQNWLVDFEASQPDKMSDQIYRTYFQDPDWAQLYEMAGLQDTAYETSEDYVRYMDDMVADRPITMVETSAGLTGGKKYVLRVELEEDVFFNFATFVMVDQKAEGDAISDWQLGQVQIFTYDEDQGMDFRRDLSYRFLVGPDSVVLVNGVELDQSHVVRTTATAAQAYLPEGVYGYRDKELQVEGLLVEPQIQIINGQGQLCQMTYDEQTRTFVEHWEKLTITDEEYATVVTAAKTYCEYMISAKGSWELRSCFDHKTPIYTTIVTNTTWMQGYSGYDFGQETVTDFYRYSDSLYSARVTVDLNVTRPDGTLKVYPLDTNFFLELQEEGWRVIEMTNVDVQAQTSTVRITYMDGDTVLATEMVDTDQRVLTPPTVTVPEGKTFLGWYVEAGRLETSEDGTIRLPDSFQLDPMAVYAMFG
ncbi:MAG: hypothetical protein IJW45_04070 [Oscillospiraceae bacterium]|nr:hypothetical protein [Oscillospiraceae bacterium]